MGGGLSGGVPLGLILLLLQPLLWLLALGNMEGDVLHNLRTNLSDPSNVLQSWNVSDANPCAWFHITCDSDDSVIRVDLGDAGLSGQLVPELGLLENLEYLELFNNSFTGPILIALGNLTKLKSLDLYSNGFSGMIPESLGKLSGLRFLRLNNNNLTGPIPTALTNIPSLQVLDLSNNRLSGVVPDNGSLALFTPASFANNLDLCGPVTGRICPGSPTSRPRGNSATGAVAGGVAAGAALLFAAPAIAFTWWRQRKRRELFFDVHAEYDPEVHHLWQLKRFSLQELLVATDSFSNKNILGRGGFGEVYKGHLADGSLVAVKRLKEARTPGGELQFQAEVGMISMAVHPNLLQLLGFCTTPTERLLVYPFMANGSVASYMRERPPSKPPLDWPTRKRIALGSAKGLSYLHEKCNPKVIHRDVKAANILLDEEFEAVVGDFGLAKLMNCNVTHVTTAVRGTIGHIPPEYFRTGRSSEKTDVFGYGITLLELITGKGPSELVGLANDDVILLDWVKRLLEEKKLEMLVDPDLQHDYIEAEVEQLIQVALLCTQGSTTERPKMSEVVRMLEGAAGLAERWDEWQKVVEVLQQEETDGLAPHRDDGSSSGLIVDSTGNLHADELSGPR